MTDGSKAWVWKSYQSVVQDDSAQASTNRGGSAAGDRVVPFRTAKNSRGDAMRQNAPEARTKFGRHRERRVHVGSIRRSHEQIHFLNAVGRAMKKLNQRLSAFNTDRYPGEEVPVEALCRDKNGTYVIPYSCCRFDDEWRNFDTDETVTANIIGWRPISEKQKYRPLRKK